MSTPTKRDVTARLKAAIAQDTFNRSTTSGSTTIASANGWGVTASDGEPWGSGTGTGMTYQIVTNGSLKMGQMTGTTTRSIKLLGSLDETNVGATVQIALSATSDEAGLILRYSGGGNQYRFDYIGGATFAIEKNVGGTPSILVSTAFTLTANSLYTIRAQCIGSALYGKIWLSSSAEPTSWTLTTTDSSLSVTGGFGLTASLNANGDTAQFANFAVYDVGATAGSSTRDVPSRTVLASLTRRDVSSRTVLAALSLRNTASRLRLSARPLRDVLSRLVLQSGSILRDIATRFILSKIRQYDTPTRFLGAISQDSFVRGSSYAPYILSEGPAAYYRMDETSGTVVHDSSGNSYTVTLSGTYTLNQPGVINDTSDPSILFDGITGTITLPPPLALALSSWSALSIEVWFAFPGEDTQHYVTLTDDGTTTLYYLDGYLYDFGEDDTPTAELLFSQMLALIGSGSLTPGSPTLGSGFIDELALYDYTLTAGQVAAHYTVGSAFPPPSAGSTNPSSLLGWGVATNPDGTSEGGTWLVYGGDGALYQITSTIPSPDILAYGTGLYGAGKYSSGVGGTQVGQVTNTADTVVLQLGTKQFLNIGALLQFSLSSAADEGGLILRSSSLGNHYRFRYDGGGNFSIARDMNGTVTPLVSTPFTLVPGSWYSVRAEAIGSYLAAKIWPAGTLESVGWMLSTFDSTQSQVSQFGLYCDLDLATDTAQFTGFAVYDAPATSRDLRTRLVLRAGILKDIIAARLVLGALIKRDIPSRLFLIPNASAIPLVRDLGVRLLIQPAPSGGVPGASGIENNVFMDGEGLPLSLHTAPYQVGGIPLQDYPSAASTPSLSGNIVAAGATFTLIFSNPSSATVTAFSSISGILMLTFPLSTGQMVTGQVAVTTTQSGTFFQVQCTLVSDLILNTWRVQTQFL